MVVAGRAQNSRVLHDQKFFDLRRSAAEIAVLLIEALRTRIQFMVHGDDLGPGPIREVPAVLVFAAPLDPNLIGPVRLWAIGPRRIVAWQDVAMVSRLNGLARCNAKAGSAEIV
jgi:hypothetical protein